MAQIDLLFPADGQWFGQQLIHFRWVTYTYDPTNFWLYIFTSGGQQIWQGRLDPARITSKTSMQIWDLPVPIVWAQDTYSWYIRQGAYTSETRHFTVKINAKPDRVK